METRNLSELFSKDEIVYLTAESPTVLSRLEQGHVFGDRRLEAGLAQFVEEFDQHGGRRAADGGTMTRPTSRAGS